MTIKIGTKNYTKISFKDEAEIEAAVVKFAKDIFGDKAVYFDIKRRIKHKGSSFENIPDGYVLDFRERPQLWVVENELAKHDSLKHIGIQLLEFASQFTEGSFLVKDLLLKALDEDSTLKKKVENLTKEAEIDSISDALDEAIFRNEFSFVVIIDEITEDLTRVTKELMRPPEILQLKKFVHQKQTAYLFDELLSEVTEAKSTKVKEVRDIDTMVAPAHADGHAQAFLKNKVWYSVRIAAPVIPKLKYLAMYEVAPVSAIRWVGSISKIEPYKNTDKYILYLSKIWKIKPIKLENPKMAPYGPRYTKFELLKKAKKISDL